MHLISLFASVLGAMEEMLLLFTAPKYDHSLDALVLDYARIGHSCGPWLSWVPSWSASALYFGGVDEPGCWHSVWSRCCVHCSAGHLGFVVYMQDKAQLLENAMSLGRRAPQQLKRHACGRVRGLQLVSHAPGVNVADAQLSSASDGGLSPWRHWLHAVVGLQIAIVIIKCLNRCCRQWRFL